MSQAPKYKGQALIEMKVVGNAVRVVAIDPDTGIEVTIVGARSTPRNLLQKQAVQKLAYVIEKKRKQAEEDAASASGTSIIV